ncbi:glycosyltransferase [Burkholderia sp. Bp8986]|uniref:glycosyltransferase n=1 Tax=Burkholderia sp. Bp8986 TaxID=2184550 RepID=UPI000F59AEB5|nr:glycosyltransferase [Burkholderia sp. Bp8986]RQS48351.1 glycosyltransferase [Burkholderia sp. Bp8986]
MTNHKTSNRSGNGAGTATQFALKHTVYYVQPLIARYRVEVIVALRQRFNVKVFASSVGVESRGFSRERPECEEFVETPINNVFRKRVKIQTRVVPRIMRERPAAVFIFADVTYVSLWLALVVGRLTRVPMVIHGQGLYRYEKPGLLRTLCYRAAVALSSHYVCYAEVSKRSLERIGCPPSKLTVASNSLMVERTVSPSEKTGTEQGVLFVGRLREGCNVEILIQAVEALVSEGHCIVLHVVGDGEQRARLQDKYAGRAHVIWHGGIFDDGEIAAISRKCRIGCYPGAAGLSVVHMFGLSLPPLVHDRLPMHMGPEPENVEPFETGFLYAQDGGADALAAALTEIWNLPPEIVRNTASRAFAKYHQLNSPSLGQRLADIVDRVIEA